MEQQQAINGVLPLFSVILLLKFNYFNVTRWNKGVEDLIRLNMLIIPLHINTNHWACAVVKMKERIIVGYDSYGGSMFDEIVGIMAYLKMNAEVKHGQLFDPKEWNVKLSNKHEIPQQKNGYDCGVFISMFMYEIVRGLPLVLTQDNTTTFRLHIGQSLCNGYIDNDRA